MKVTLYRFVNGETGKEEEFVLTCEAETEEDRKINAILFRDLDTSGLIGSADDDGSTCQLVLRPQLSTTSDQRNCVPAATASSVSRKVRRTGWFQAARTAFLQHIIRLSVNLLLKNSRA